MKNFDSIQEGDIVQHLVTGNSYVVHAIIESINVSLFLVRTIHAENPSEWKLVAKAIPCEVDKP